MNRRWAFILLLVVAGCQRQEAPARAARKKAPPRPVPAVENAPRTEVGDIMPPYSSAYLGGKTFDLASEKGQVVLLNVWATWCGPCRVEIPELQTLHDKYQKRGFKVIGVSVDETAEDAVKQFVDEEKVRYPVAFDPDGKVATILQTTVLPTSVIIDRSGKIVWRRVGRVRPNDLEEVHAIVEKALGVKPPSS